jgi:exodeoxyribonuclease V gamma subunit
VEQGFRLQLSTLAAFLRQPVRHFFRQRLGVYFGESALLGEDEEPFQLDGLQRYALEDAMLSDSGEAEAPDQVRDSLRQRGQRLRRQGVLPIGLIGERVLDELVEELVPVRTAWLTLCGTYWEPAPKLALHLELAGLVLEDWIDQLRSAGEATAWLMQMSSRVCDKAGAPRGEKLIPMWLRQLAAAAQGQPVTGFLVARDAIVVMEPLEPLAARAALERIVALWREGMDRPLPAACKTGLALVMDGDPRSTYDGGFELSGEVEDPCLARLWPEFAALAAEAGFSDACRALYQPLADWLAQSVTVQPIAAEGEGGQ